MFQLISPYNFIGNWCIGQFLFNPLIFVASVFSFYCFKTTPVAIASNSKVKLAQYIWLLHHTSRGLQQIVFYTFGVLPDLLEFPFTLLVFLIVNSFITALLILLLHLFFPEAVLISHEQIIRATKMYKFASPHNNAIAKLGINTINNYLEFVISQLGLKDIKS